MSIQILQERLNERLKEKFETITIANNEITLEITPKELPTICRILRDDKQFGFEQLIDLCGIDYLTYGCDDWETDEATLTGFSRGVETVHAKSTWKKPRFAVIYHLLSVSNNWRVRLRVLLPEANLIIPSVIAIWASAQWYEREAFDLFGILFDGHPDLRRILTDYGFIGHPFRKDFPLSGHVEVRYDPEQKRVIYQPVSIEPRILVPKVIRDDNRYQEQD
ncbi:MAG: NADH-quinone oxidoreductase subunit C [Gammaproteobacteria bacterium]